MREDALLVWSKGVLSSNSCTRWPSDAQAVAMDTPLTPAPTTAIRFVDTADSLINRLDTGLCHNSTS